MTAPHGTEGAYVNLRCRCAPCTDAHRAYSVTRRADRFALRVPDATGRLVTTVTSLPHGSASTYKNWGCRCWPCTEASATDQRRHRRQRRRAARRLR